MIVLVGASASGKTEVTKVLDAKYNIKKFITHTTRQIRVGEKDGVDYHFVTKEQFEELLAKDSFVEHTLYNGNYYGTSKKEIAQNKVVAIDPNGVQAFKKLHDKTIIIFKLYAKENTRYNRMLQRGDSLENTNSRIVNDRTSFDDEKIGEVNFEIDTDKYDVEGVADLIYELYTKALSQL